MLGSENKELGEIAISSPGGFAWAASEGEWKRAKHLDYLNRKIVEVAAERLKYLIVSFPPRHGKSELVSRYTPAWYVGNFPNKRVILTGYEADFASDWGFQARSLIEDVGPELFGIMVDPDQSAKNNWGVVDAKTKKKLRGGMKTAGAGGPITGKGANLFIIDDPIKNHEDALSETQREKLWNWYRSTTRTRLEPNAGIILIMTRWHPDDLAGRLIKMLRSGKIDKPYEIINFPAMAGKNDVLGRKPGEALWPWRYPKSELLSLKEELQSFWWSALYQGDPIPEGGKLFHRSWFKIVDEPPECVVKLRFWDMAYGGDWSVGCLLGITEERRVVILDVIRIKLYPGEAEILVKTTAHMDGYDTLVRMEQEPGSAGKAEIIKFAELLDGYDFEGILPREDKMIRYRPLSRQAQAGKVYLVNANWNTTFLDELEYVPSSAHDDQADAAAGAYNEGIQQVSGREVVII